jgi:hypothetical protein
VKNAAAMGFPFRRMTGHGGARGHMDMRRRQGATHTYTHYKRHATRKLYTISFHNPEKNFKQFESSQY